VHSSTSSSSWGRAWLLALGFLAVTLCGWEYILRERGYHPSVEDSMELWSWQRQNATGSTPIVLLGASRLLHGIDTATLRRRYPHKPIVNLAIKGRYPLAVLQHLAADETFAGTVVVSVVAQALEPVYENMQQEYVDFFDEHSRLDGRINARMMAGLEHRIVSLHPLLSLQYLGNYLYKYGRYPKPFYMWTLEDRSIDGDFQLVNSVVLRAQFVKQKAANYRNIPPSKPDLWQQWLVTGPWMSSIIHAIFIGIDLLLPAKHFVSISMMCRARNNSSCPMVPISTRENRRLLLR